jgi:hypothetical protein
MFSIVFLLPDSLIQMLFSLPCPQTHSSVPLQWVTKFHMHIKQHNNLFNLKQLKKLILNWFLTEGKVVLIRLSLL